MKPTLTVLLLLALGVMGCSPKPAYINTPTEGTITEPYLAMLAVFYQDQADRPDYNTMAQAVDATKEASALLCLEDQVPTILAMWHRESAYNPKAKGLPREDSAGVSQTRMKELKVWRPFWRSRGIILEPFKTSVRTQVFFGVAEYADKLRLAHGDVLQAVRRYNGGSMGGPGLARASRYAKKVMVSRKVIFDKPYTKGETAEPCP